MRDVSFLVVDDSAMVRRLISSVIRTKLGSNRIVVASDGSEALTLIGKHHFDIIISDWNMEQVGGDELLQRVRSDPQHRDVPFIMVTTNTRRDYIMTALQLGVTQYLVKPFTPAELEHKIRSSWSAASKRKSERYADLPEHCVAIGVAEGKVLEGTLVNISRTGALVRLKYSDELGLFHDYPLRMSFKEDGSEWRLDQLKGTGLRLESDADNRQHCLFAMDFLPESITPQTANQLESLLEWLESRAPKLIDE